MATNTKAMNLVVTKSDLGGFDGYASTWYTLDKVGDVIMPGAFKSDLPRFLNENFIGDINHNYGDPIGRFTESVEDGKGLYVKAVYSDVPRAKVVRTLINDRVIQTLSIGFVPKEVKYVSPDELKLIWAKGGYQPTPDDLERIKMVKKIKLITKAKLLEVSPTPVPVNDEARILSFKSWEECPPAFKTFCRRVIQSCRQIAGVDLKAGRVLSSKNEQRLRSVLDVLNSLTKEVNNLLLLAGSQMEEGPEEEEGVEPDEATEEPGELEESPEEEAQETATDAATEAARLKLILELMR
jgi:HK97 family phage prohead protease